MSEEGAEEPNKRLGWTAAVPATVFVLALFLLSAAAVLSVTFSLLLGSD